MESVISSVAEILGNTWRLFVDAAPWLVFGLLVAGFIKAFVSEQRVAAWLGGRGLWPVSKAALVGAPLPLCSCSVIPVAIGLHRAGASRASTTAFLISTPETGVDSVAASYVLLGPFLTVARPIAATASALITGVISNLAPIARHTAQTPTPRCNSARLDSDCCESRFLQSDACDSSAPNAAASCCEIRNTSATTSCCTSRDQTNETHEKVSIRLRAGLHYAITQIFGEFAPWFAAGLLVAGITLTFVPPSALAHYGSGLPAMLVLLALGVPMYVCATESTPIATAMLVAGVSPGAVLVFLLAGPATNVATIGAVRQEFGSLFAVIYLASVGLCALAFGLLTNAIAGWIGHEIVPHFGAQAALASDWITLPCAVVLLLLAIPPLRGWLTRGLARSQ